MRGRCQRGALARADLQYWKVVLQIQAPHLYLEPFLPRRAPLEGCDLACGWGRICLGLSEYRQRRIHACDLDDSSLRTLRRLSKNRNLEGVIETHRTSILHLPFENDRIDFFLAFDILTQMTDESLRQCLRETLRCGKRGCVLYAEVPLKAYCPAVTHVQNWDHRVLRTFVEGVRAAGKRWRMRQWSPSVPEHFTFVIERDSR